MKTLLALETATRACSVALSHKGRIHRFEEMTPRGHAARILSMVEAVMSEAECGPAQLDGLILGHGPGAFTGLRIAASVVQGLALGWGCPVAALSGLEAMARHESLARGGAVLAALDARMGECYVAVYERGDCHLPARLVSPQEAVELFGRFEVVTGVGDAGALLEEVAAEPLRWQEGLPSASHLLEWALAQPPRFAALDAGPPMPLYLRNRVADKPEGGR